MLRGLKHEELHITAIVTVADDGGSSGILRSELQIPPPGDIRNVIMALADVEPLLSQMLQYRFESGTGLAGHSLGNLILAAMKDIAGDFVTGVKELSRVLAVRGRVLPACEHAIELFAELEDGRIVKGESKIPKAGARIKRVFIEPENIHPLPETLQALEEADAIILGPGSLYTSIIPNVLVPGITEAIVRSKALKIFICNVMTQPGETDGYTAGDHVEALLSHVGADIFDVILVNNGVIPEAILQKYRAQSAGPALFDEEKLKQFKGRIVADELWKYQMYLRHDEQQLSKLISKLVEEYTKKEG